VTAEMDILPKRPDNFPDDDSIRRIARAMKDAVDWSIEIWAREASLESPIERLLLAALQGQVALGTWCGMQAVVLSPRCRAVASDVLTARPGFRPLIIEPQKEVCGCRVDFLITTCRSTWDDALIGEAKLVVECDGHDFHERTEEQARRDRSRDREFQSAGYTVFRFTGAEIWKNAWACAYQIGDWASEKHYE
jgi:very-short-patch-repair endonuclease